MYQDQRIDSRRFSKTHPLLGLTKRCLLGDGTIVPVDEADDADDAEDESSSGEGSDNGANLPASSLSSSSATDAEKRPGGSIGSNGRLVSLALANDRCRLLMLWSKNCRGLPDNRDGIRQWDSRVRGEMSSGR